MKTTIFKLVWPMILVILAVALTLDNYFNNQILSIYLLSSVLTIVSFVVFIYQNLNVTILPKGITAKEMIQLLQEVKVRLQTEDEYVVSGLCSAIISLRNNNFIDYREHAILDSFIDLNRPKRYQRYFCRKYRNDGYYWKPLLIPIRIQFLDYKIKQLQQGWYKTEK